MVWRAGTEDGPAGGWRAGTEDAAPFSGGVSVHVIEPGDVWGLVAGVQVRATAHVVEPGDVWSIESSASIISRLHVVEPGDVWSIDILAVRSARLHIVEEGDVWSFSAEVIPIPPSPYDVWKINTPDVICARLIPRLHDSPVLRQVLAVPAGRADELLRALWSVLPIRSLKEARGVWLETIGRIVGLYPRPTLDAGNIVYFTPDNDLGTPDYAPVYVTGAPLADQVPAEDGNYLTQIEAQIFRNHIRHGSVPELKQWILLAYGIECSVRRLGLSEVRIIVPDSTPEWLVDKLASYTTTDEAEVIYHVPLPADAVLESVVTVSEDV